MRGRQPRRFLRPLRLAAAALLLGGFDAARAQEHALPPSALRVRDAGGWATWWRSSDPPARWGATPRLAGALRMRQGALGVTWGETVLAGAGEAWRTRLVVVIVDPRLVRLTLDTAFSDRGAGWRVDRLGAADSATAVFAVNAGQFVQSLPWGLVVLDGAPYLRAGPGPLASAVAIDSSGRVHWRHGDAAATALPAGVRWAFQSYPTLLRAGVVPAPLQCARCGVDVVHRDARLAIGRLADGRLVVAMTRFDGLGEALARLPFGLTSPEMAAVMAALGARDAVMLDGGISAQMLVRDARGTPRTWRGLRAVPLALVARRVRGRADTPASQGDTPSRAP